MIHTDTLIVDLILSLINVSGSIKPVQITITSSGEFGFEKGGIRESAGHLAPHLRTLSRYLGAESMYEIAAEYQEFGDDRHVQSVASAISRAESLAAELSQQQCYK